MLCVSVLLWLHCYAFCNVLYCVVVYLFLKTTCFVYCVVVLMLYCYVNGVCLCRVFNQVGVLLCVFVLWFKHCDASVVCLGIVT